MPSLEASDPAWSAAFAWAVRQADAHRHDVAPIGPCYEAALPGRSAFCVRDICHQSTGAGILGMARHTRNMLRRFAASIADARDWCPYWEITYQGTPAAVDYTDDQHFWYNLPGSFDLIDACWRQYQWTGDPDYLQDPVFTTFYRRTLTDFVARWDRDGDGLPDHRPADGSRGIATYNEQIAHPRLGGDLLGTMYAALRAHAAILAATGDTTGARAARRRAVALRRRYNATWWNTARQRFAGLIDQDGRLSEDYGYEGNFLPLYFGLPAGPARVRGALEALSAHGAPNVEGLTYVVDTLLRCGRVADAMRLLMTIATPDHPRSTYPEVSFCAAGALVHGLAGLSPDATAGRVETVAQLPAPDDWLRVGPVPVLDSTVTVHHSGQSASRVTAESGPGIVWRAVFPGIARHLLVGGRSHPAGRLRRHGRWHSFIDVPVAAGQTASVSCSR